MLHMANLKYATQNLRIFYMTCDLTKKSCVPCQGGIPPLKGEKLRELHDQLRNQWSVIDEHHLKKEFSFPDFQKALDFTVKVGEIAEREGHHPDINLAYGKVDITIFTHKIDGLSESDFILAAKIDELKPLAEQTEA